MTPNPGPTSQNPASQHPTAPSAAAPRPRCACEHSPRCPEATAADHDAARVVSRHSEQGWSLLCNGVVVFDDTGELLPDGSTVAPHRPACRLWFAA